MNTNYLINNQDLIYILTNTSILLNIQLLIKKYYNLYIFLNK